MSSSNFFLDEQYTQKATIAIDRRGKIGNVRLFTSSIGVVVPTSEGGGAMSAWVALLEAKLWTFFFVVRCA